MFVRHRLFFEVVRSVAREWVRDARQGQCVILISCRILSAPTAGDEDDLSASSNLKRSTGSPEEIARGHFKP